MPLEPIIALIVETNYLVAAAIETPLLEHGFQVLIATDSNEARELLAGHAAKVAIIDFRLQHGQPDGLVSLLEARRIPYVFCTASSLEGGSEHFPRAEVIEKPFSDEDLLAVVAALQNSTRSERNT